jgi:hypothetical protein
VASLFPTGIEVGSQYANPIADPLLSLAMAMVPGSCHDVGCQRTREDPGRRTGGPGSADMISGSGANSVIR